MVLLAFQAELPIRKHNSITGKSVCFKFTHARFQNSTQKFTLTKHFLIVQQMQCYCNKVQTSPEQLS